MYKYASKIKTLFSDMETCLSHVLEPAIITVFLHANDRRRFFPTLRSLSASTYLCAFNQPEYFAPIFLVPSLVSLQLTIFDKDMYHSLTEYLGGSGTNIEKFSIRTDSGARGLSVLVKLSQLRKFIHTGHPLDACTWPAIRALPKLSLLIASLGPASPSVPLALCEPRVIWETHLQSLHLTVADTDSLVVYLKDVVCPQLTSLSIYISSTQPLRSQQFQNVVQVIDNLVPSNRPSRLSELHLSLGHTWVPSTLR